MFKRGDCVTVLTGTYTGAEATIQGTIGDAYFVTIDSNGYFVSYDTSELAIRE